MSRDFRQLFGLFHYVAVLSVWLLTGVPESQALPQGQWFNIVSTASGKCLDVRVSAPSDGDHVVSWQCEPGRQQQQWAFVSVSGGKYQLVLRASGHVLSVAEPVGDGANVQVESWVDVRRQKWLAVPRADGTYELVLDQASKRVDLATPYDQDGSNIRAWQSNSSVAQSWQIAPASPEIGGQWGAVIPWPHVAVSAANLPDGRILTWSGSERRTWPTTEQTYSATWNADTGVFVEIFHPSHNMFCAHLAMTEDGQVFVNGGRNQTNSPWTSLFDFRDNSWTQIENMATGGRWYPTTLALGDGTIMTANGTATNQRNPDLWSSDEGWRVLNGVDFNALRQGHGGNAGERRWWSQLSLAPNGNIFHFWDTDESHFLGTHGSGHSRHAHPTTDGGAHAPGISLYYDVGKLLMTGSNQGSWQSAASAQAFTIDLNDSRPYITATNPMHFVRKYHQMIPLPTGEVLVIGGNTSGTAFSDNGTVYATEIWNPITQQWRHGAAMSVPRNYHSVGLLLADGRVLAAGGGYGSGNANLPATHQDGQLYSPPYLFDSNGLLAARPSITNGPSEVEAGHTFEITTTGDIAYFSLIKMSATTHAVNTGARFFKPSFTSATATTHLIDMHANPHIAVPGYWMLFAVDTEGVPSRAHILHVGAVDTRLDNIALRGTATQSSTYNNEPHFAPDRAIDGDLSGASDADSLSHTQNELNAWWEIDLGHVYELDTVRLWNRTDCCEARLTDFHVLVSDVPFESQDLAPVQAQEHVMDIHVPGVAGRQTDLSIGRTGRYVRVQLSHLNYLQLAEVQIFAQPGIVVDARGTIAVTQTDASSWQQVRFRTPFDEAPMIIMGPPSYGDADPTTVRVRNVTAAGFEFQLDEWDYLDGIHNEETIAFLALPQGQHDFGGVRAEVGAFTANHNFTSVNFSQPFSNPPVVLAQTVSVNDGAAVTVRLNNVDANGFAARVQEEEGHDGSHAAETVHYIALSEGIGLLDGFKVAARRTGDTHDDTWQAIDFGDAFNNPVFLATTQTSDGGDPIALRYRNLSPDNVEIVVEEEQSANSEVGHTFEVVGWLVIASAPDLAVQPIVSTPQTSGTAVEFTAQAVGPGPLLYRWNFGDGSGDTSFTTASTVSHIYSAPGRYVVIVTVRDANGNEVQVTFTHVVHAPLAVNQPRVSSSLVYHGGRDEVWNVNPDNDSVTVVSTISHAVIAEIAVGDEPRGLALAPDGRVWVTNKHDSTISIIDPASLTVTETLSLGLGVQPHGIVAGSSGAYVVLEASGEIVKFDITSRVEVRRASLGVHPRHLSLDSGETTLYVSRFVTPRLPGEETSSPVVYDGIRHYGGEVLKVDASSLALNATITLQHSDRSVSEHSGPGLPNYLGPPVISPDGSAAWVPSKQDNILAGGLRGGPGMTFDQTVRAISSRIDLATTSETFVSRVDHDNASVAGHAVFGPYGVYLFTALEGNRQVALSDVYSATEIARFDVGRAPQGLAVSDDGRTLYVHNFMDRSVGIYDISEIFSNITVPVTELATVSVVASGSEALPAEILLGKQHFYDARDPRLALQSYMSCASCHNEGGQDGRVWDFTHVGEGLRNTITLKGRAGMAHGRLHWSANFDEVQDFEAQIRMFSAGTGLMSDTDFNAGTRSQPLGDPKAGLSPDLDALAAYLASLTGVGDTPHRDAGGALTAEAAQGRLVFQSRGCVDCHGGQDFTDSPASPLHNIGTIKPSSGQRLGAPLSGLDTPTLRGLWATAPYLHDGSAATLRQAVTAHQGLSLTALDLDHLSAFLHQIDDREPAPTVSACGDLDQEAEVGQLSGAFAIGSDAGASGGQYVHVPNGTGNNSANSTNHVTYCFTVTTPGIYYLKGWVYAGNGSEDSFFVRIDGFPATGYLWDVLQNTGYAMDYVSNRNGDNPVELTLTAGEHQIVVYQREDGTRLDRLVLELVDDQLPPAEHELLLGHSGNGSVTANPTQAAYISGTTVQLSASADAGWHFVGWTGDIEASTNPLTVMMDRDLSVTAVFVETTSDGCGGLVQEAEAGERFGAFVIGNDAAASGGQYIHVPNGVGSGAPDGPNSVHYCFLVLTPGRYRLEGNVYGATGRDDSFFVRIDGQPVSAYLWDFPKNTAYAPDQVSDRNGTDPVEVVLAAGEHTVVVNQREDGARLDKLTFTFVEAVSGLAAGGSATPSDNLVTARQTTSSGPSTGGFQLGRSGNTSIPPAADGPNQTISESSALWVNFVDASATRLALAASADTQAKRMAIGDLNRDGWDDVIVARKTPFGGTDAHRDMLLLNETGVLHDRTATYAAGFLSSPTPASDVLVVDIDGDDWPDVVIVTTGGQLPRVYRNLGRHVDGQWLGLEHEQTWLPVMDRDNAHFCAAAADDLTGDGALDLYLVNCKANLHGRDALLVNNGSGYLSEESQTRLGPFRQSALGTDVNLVDMDGDGDLDVVKLSLGKAIPPWQQTGAFVLYNDGRGYFNAWQALAGSTTTHIGSSDLDEDGQADLYVVDQGADRVLLAGRSIVDTQVDVMSQAVMSMRTAGSGGRLQFADLDGDGDLDVGIADVGVFPYFRLGFYQIEM